MDDEGPKLPSVGDVVGGKYRVDRVIGKGGMGSVLAVRHLGLDELRALKLMLPRGLELPQARERFFREARAAAKLRSEHAVAVHDVGVLPDGFPYIEMELLEGTDLAQRIKRGSISVHSAVDWIAQACEAVGEAHAHGIVHRDLKPGNLFLSRTPTGREIIKVLDFGIAKTVGGDSDPTLTSTNASFGSPVYMSPEQMRGARYASPRSDIWALGVVLFELLTGRRPFSAESVTALALTVTSDPAPRPSTIRGDVPAAVESLVMRCLEKDPAARFSSAGELAAALRASIGLVAPAMRGSLASLSAAPPSARGAAAPAQLPAPQPETPAPDATRASPSGAPTQLVEPSTVTTPTHPPVPIGHGAPLPYAGSGASTTSRPSVASVAIGGTKAVAPRPAFLALAILLTAAFGSTAALLMTRARTSPAAPVTSPSPVEPEAQAKPEPAPPPAVEPEPPSLGPGPPASATAISPVTDAPSGASAATPQGLEPALPPGSASARGPRGRAPVAAPRPPSGFGGVD